MIRYRLKTDTFVLSRGQVEITAFATPTTERGGSSITCTVSTRTGGEERARARALAELRARIARDGNQVEE